MKTKAKLPTRVKINIGIFMVMTILFAVAPKILFNTWFPNNDEGTYYQGGFSYILHDICPCHTGEDDCIGYHACGPDKANITYNLDTAPADLLTEAKRDQYFENLIESNRQGNIVSRLYLLCDISYLMAFISLVAGILYWNHNMAKSQ